MILSLIIGLIFAVCLVSTLIVYVVIRSHHSFKSSNHEKQQIKYSFTPSFDMITKHLTQETPSRASTSSGHSSRSISTTKYAEVNEFPFKHSSKSVESLLKPMIPSRSASVASNVYPNNRLRSSNSRHGSIFDSNQIAAIRFTLPSANYDSRYRRQSVPVLHTLIEPRINLLTTVKSRMPCLLTFTLTHLENGQLKIHFQSLQGLPNDIQLQLLLIKVKLSPDGKEKSLQIRKYIQNEIRFNDEVNPMILLFSNISKEKFPDKSLTMTVQGKDQTKKSIHFGQIGKIHFNGISSWPLDQPIEFVHEIEKVKQSSIELLIALKQLDDQHLHLDLQRIKGLKIDQKKSDAKFYFQILLLDRHRIMLNKQTKSFSMNSSNLILDEQHELNILSFNGNNLDRLMILINFYSNSNHENEYKRLAHLKLASTLFCSGSGTIHWQQFKARQSFSMWHTLNKQ